MLLADVNAMWLMAINAFMSDVVDTCFLDIHFHLEVLIVTDGMSHNYRFDVITTAADGITTIG